MNLYTADLHLGHKTVLRFDQRPFSDVEEMDKTLLRLWNEKVQPEDDVYILGDFAYKSEIPEEWYLRQMKGKKHLIIGNHDNHLLKNDAAMSYIESAEKMQHVMDEKTHLCLCHFPIAEWNGFYKGCLDIYAHIHNRKDETYELMKTRRNAFNAGCMLNNYMPVSLQELQENNRIFQDDSVIGTVRK